MSDSDSSLVLMSNSPSLLASLSATREGGGKSSAARRSDSAASRLSFRSCSVILERLGAGSLTTRLSDLLRRRVRRLSKEIGQLVRTSSHGCPSRCSLDKKAPSYTDRPVIIPTLLRAYSYILVEITSNRR